MMSPHRQRILSFPIPVGERDALRAVLKKAGLPFEDIDAPALHVWRFEGDDALVGFGGIELHGDFALLRSLVTLPPLRGRGWGRTITGVLEVEAIALGCRTLYVITVDQERFFAQQGYEACRREDLPAAIRDTPLLKTHCPASAAVMMKQLA